MATVLNNVFPWGMYYGGDTAPNGAWGIIDEKDRTKIHVTSDIATPNLVNTFANPVVSLVCDGTRWVALVATGTGHRFHRSTDGLTGAAWEQVGVELSFQDVIAGSGNGLVFRRGPSDIFRSTDGGATWAVSISAATLSADGVDISTIDGLFAGDGAVWLMGQTPDGVSPKVYVSSDNGVAWTLRNGPPVNLGDIDDRYYIALVGVTDGVLYLDGERGYADDYRVYRSTDLGVTWVDVSADLPGIYGHGAIISRQGLSYFFSSVGGLGQDVAVRRVSGAGAPAVIETIVGLGAWPGQRTTLVSTEKLAMGRLTSFEDERTFVIDLPSLGEAVEFLSTVSTAVGLTEFELTHLQFLSSTIVASATSTEGAVSAQIVSSTTVAALVLGAQFELASLGSVVSASPTLTGAGTFAIALESGALITFATTDDEGATDVWVLNLDVGGLTRYEGFNFNSFAKIGANYYGCKEDGIYQLDGDTDAGAPIRSMVSFGKQDFGASALKRITNAYVGVSGQGRLFLRVMAEGQEYTYAARSYDEHLQVQRFDTGKGLRVNWLEFELYNADGEDFELASIEFAVVPTSRRI